MRNLTTTTLKRLVGNWDAYATMNDPAAGGNKWNVVRHPLTEDDLRSHLEGNVTIGSYTLRGEEARTLVFDLDDYDEPGQLLIKAEEIREALINLGFPRFATAIEFSGGKGYHVWLVFREYVDAKKLRRVGRHVLGLTGTQCEVFPKQDSAVGEDSKGKPRLGNFVKLPGGYHRYAEAWSEFVTATPLPASPKTLDDVIARLPEEPESSRSDYEGPDALTCVHHMVQGPPEGFRNNGLFQVAVMARKAGWDDATVELVVRSAYEKMDKTDFPESELVALLESSKDSGPICHVFDGTEHHCGEACVLNRTPGLYTRSKKLTFAQPGEKVVVEVEERHGKTLVLDHPDIKSGGRVTVK